MTVNFPIALPGMCIGLLGGSFDPAHEGHVNLTEIALRQFDLDRVWWLVSPGNPLKQHGPRPMAERLTAANAIMQDPRVEITDIEERLGTRMTADTIAALQRLYPGVRFVWLMGSDNLLQFNKWDRWREIAARVPIGVLARPGTRLAARLSPAAQIMKRARLPEAKARKLPLMKPPAWVLLNMHMSPLSSTAIRQSRKGKSR